MEGTVEFKCIISVNFIFCSRFALDIKTQIDLNRTNPMCETFKQLNPLKIYNFNNTFSVKEPYVRVLLFFSPDENISVRRVDIFIDGCNSFFLLD